VGRGGAREAIFMKSVLANELLEWVDHNVPPEPSPPGAPRGLGE
jgi:hypothetical protein